MTPGIRVLTGHDGQRFTFDPGSLCLDLLATGGPGEYRRWEALHEPADLAGWLTGSALARPAPLDPADIALRPADLGRVRELRDTLWPVVQRLARGEGVLDPAAVALVNDAAAAAPCPRLDPATGQRRWVTPLTGAQVLGAVARDAIDVLARTDGRLRECAGGNCELLFLDTSRPGSRRWCSMERCGNRNKVRGYRTRHA